MSRYEIAGTRPERRASCCPTPPGLAGADLSTGRAMIAAELVILVLGLTLVGAAVWVPSLSDTTRTLLLLLVLAAGTLVVLRRLTAP